MIFAATKSPSQRQVVEAQVLPCRRSGARITGKITIAGIIGRAITPPILGLVNGGILRNQDAHRAFQYSQSRT